MNMQKLYKKFSKGIVWNAFLFLVYKLLFISLTFLLYGRLTVQDFSLWANVNCIIYLLLLWLDFGFRKSLPRYAPEFSKNKITMQKFITFILIFHLIVLCIASPVFLFLIARFATTIGLSKQVSILYLGCILFIVEGILATFRLIYHSYFWQKNFNILNALTLVTQLVLSIGSLYVVEKSIALLQAIFIIKIGTSILMLAIATVMLRWLYQTNTFSEKTKINISSKGWEFAKHSSIMWASTNIKSLTERNFLVPLFTWQLGPSLANLFKVANDSALFFQRLILKTIGTTDTSLLSYIEKKSKNSVLLPQVFKKLTTKIISLCVPLLGLLVAWYFYKKNTGTESSTSHLFFVLAIGYLLQVLISPYERILEVKKKYIVLMIAYLPYLFFVPLFLYFNHPSPISLFYSVLLVQSIRLISALMMAIFVRYTFSLKYPFFLAIIFFSFSCSLSFLICKIGHKICNFIF